jgi:hypothetical protein
VRRERERERDLKRFLFERQMSNEKKNMENKDHNEINKQNRKARKRSLHETSDIVSFNPVNII